MDRDTAEHISEIVAGVRKIHKRLPRAHAAALKRMVTDFLTGLLPGDQFAPTIRALEDSKPRYWDVQTRIAGQYFSPEALKAE